MTGVLLALASSLSFGSADFLGGLMSRKLPTLIVLFASQLIAVTAFGLIVLLTGAEIPSDSRFFLYAIVAGFGEGVGLAAFYRGLAVGAMGVVAPISASSAVVPVAFGLASGESLTTIEAVGVVLAFTGVIAVGWEPGAEGERGNIAAGVGLALFAALGLGVFFVFISQAVERSDVGGAVFVNRVALVLLVGFAVLALKERPRTAMPMIGPLALIGVLDIGGATLFAGATSFGLLAIVGAIAALYPIATVILARVFLAERLVLGQRLGAVAGLAGVALIASVQ